MIRLIIYGNGWLLGQLRRSVCILSLFSTTVISLLYVLYMGLQIASPVLSRGNYPVTLRLLHTQPLLSSTCNLPSNQGLPSDQYLLCKVRLLFKTQLFNPHLLRMHTMVKVCFNDQETTNLRLCFLINFICDYHLHIFCFTLIGLANL